MNISSLRKVRLFSGVLLPATLLFVTCAAWAQAPLAMLSEARGVVQIIRGGKTLPGKLGAPLQAGDRVRVVRGHATVFSVSRAPQSLGAGQQTTIGATGASSAPSVWRNVFKGLAHGVGPSGTLASFRPATVRPNQIEVLAPVNSKIWDARPHFVWSRGQLDGLTDCKVEIRADGFSWNATTTQNDLIYPADAPPLQVGKKYFWRVLPRDANGLRENAISPDAWFQIAAPDEIKVARADLTELQRLVSDKNLNGLMSAAALSSHGLSAAAIARLADVTQADFAERVESLDVSSRALLGSLLAQSGMAKRFAAFNEIVAALDFGSDDLPRPQDFESLETMPADVLKTYDDPDGVFSLKIPASWGTLRNKIGEISSTDFGAAPMSSPQVAVAVAPRAALGEKSFADTLFALTKGEGAFQVQPSQQTTFRDKPALKTEFAYSYQKMAVAGWVLEFSVGERAFAFVARHNASEESTPDLRRTFALAESLVSGLQTESTPHTVVATNFDTLMAELKEILATMTTLNQSRAGRAAPQQKPQTIDAARAALTAKEKVFRTAPQDSLQRADAARAAAISAADLAWLLWDAKKPSEAQPLFARRDALARESYDNERHYYQAKITETDKRLAQVRAQTVDLQLALPLFMVQDGWLDVQAARAGQLQSLATDNADPANELKYSILELHAREEQLKIALLSGATEKDVLGRRLRAALAISSIGNAQQDAADYQSAEQTFKLSLAWHKALPENYADRALDGPLRNLALLASSSGDYAAARDYYEQALKTMNADEDTQQKAIAEWKDEDLRILKTAERRQARAVLYNNLGIIVQTMGDYGAAQEFFDKALEAVEPLPQTGFAGWTRASQRAATLGNIAVLYGDSGKTDEALKLGAEVIAIHRSLGDEDGAALWLLNYAGLLAERRAPGDRETARRNVEQARRSFLAARKLSRVVYADTFLAQLEREAGNWISAETFAREALEFARATHDSETLASGARTVARVALAQALRAKSTPEKKAYFQTFDAAMKEAEQADVRLGSPLSRIPTLSLRARGREARGDLNGALADYKASIALLEAVRATASSSASFSELHDNYVIYEGIVRLLLKMNRAEEAFDYLSRARSKKLQDGLKLSSIESHDKALQTLLDLATTLQNKLGVVRAQLQTERAKPAEARDNARVENLQDVAASTQAEFFKVSAQIKAANPNYEKVLTIKPRVLKNAQPSIPADTVLIQYAPLGEQLYVFVVTQTDLKILTPKVRPADLEKAVREFRALMATAQSQVQNGEELKPVEDNAALKSSITNLYAMLIAPIEGAIKNKSTIAFIPNGLLYYLPMHALAKQTPQGLRFLIEDKRVAYLAAADVLSFARLRSDAQFGTGVLALGDPTGANLPAAGEEAREVAKIFPSSQALTGAGATKNVLLDAKNLDRRVLHFATHGVLDSANSDESYIQLAPHDKSGSGDVEADDGKLKIGEIYGLPLNRVDLVTLSACQTALGQRDPDGGEITSLAEAFAGAGAPTVVASLWSVEDESTQMLMEEFYRALAAGGGKAQSLQRAQIALLKNPKTRHPFFWAPFEVLGDWR